MKTKPERVIKNSERNGSRAGRGRGRSGNREDGRNQRAGSGNREGVRKQRERREWKQGRWK